MTSPILYIDSSVKFCSVAIADGTQTLASRHAEVLHSAAEQLNVLIGDAMSECSLFFSQLCAICISGGPGSYTGLRIAASSAKGFCYALDIPLISVSTLEMMVDGAIHRYLKSNYDVYVPMIDARRMEVFCGSYTSGTSVISEPGPKIITADTFNSLYEIGKVFFFGDGAEKCRPYLDKDNFTVWSGYETAATDLVRIGAARYKNQIFEDIAYFEPSYLKAYHFR